MKAEIPAVGIMKTSEWGDAVAYKIACSCGDDDHAHDLWIEAEDTGVNVNLYTTQKTDYWTEAVKPNYSIGNEWLQEFDWFWKGLWNGLCTRVRLTKNIWFDGYVKYQATTSMTEQQALNYAEALKSAVKDSKEFRNQRNEKK